MSVTLISYDNMIDIAKNLKNEEAQIMSLLKSTKSKVESLRDQWAGQTADNFFTEMEQTVLPMLDRLAYVLGVSADVALDIVNTIRQADEETSSFFNNIGDLP